MTRRWKVKPGRQEEKYGNKKHIEPKRRFTIFQQTQFLDFKFQQKKGLKRLKRSKKMSKALSRGTELSRWGYLFRVTVVSF